MPTFVHSGDLGDIIFSLPVVRFMGGGILYLRNSPFTRARMTWEHAQAIVPLLKAQSYIEDVREFKGENCDIDLDCFRGPMFAALHRDVNTAKHFNLYQWYSRTFDVPEAEWDRKWIEVPPVDSDICRVVVNRSPRYRNNRFPWQSVGEKYRGVTAIGLIEESDSYEQWWTFHPTRTLLEAAQVIDNAKLFIGNQSCCYAIAEGMKKPAVLEVYERMPNCLFHRDHCWHGWDENVFLPDLKDLQ